VGSRGTDALIFNVGIRWSPVVNLPLGKNSCTILIGDWGGVRDSQDVSEKRKFPSSRGIRHPDCPTRSLAINWLSTWLSLPNAMKSSYCLVPFFEA